MHSHGVPRTASGYEWVLPGSLAAVSLIKAAWAEHLPPGIGAARQRKFVLRLNRIGIHELTFELRRPWEDDAAPAARKHVVVVHVHPAS
ncbi:protease inhibitor I42 family protein [Kribbella sp. NPDC050820]|uniref:protease inhibitor I42 family protein n=1 Tax=Kribbella sp. NPDC050820 TaxID=3155408 RepID=UPI0033DCBA94